MPTPDPTATPEPTPEPTATPTPTPNATPSQALNISTRLRVLTGDNALIGGFIITGNDSKKVVIRAIGPSLAQFFPDALADPTLELFQGNTLLASNDNWIDNRVEVEATTIPPTHDSESAIVATLAPGAYTAIVRGKSESTGVGLVEAYDLDQGANSLLANISTRGFVLTDSNVMIGGFILGGGNQSTTVVLRAIGPSLAASGVSDSLANPTLDLRNGNGAQVAFNDNWEDDPAQAAQLLAIGIAPLNPLESALVVSIAPGPYTAIVSGKDGMTGVGLVELYNLR